MTPLPLRTSLTVTYIGILALLMTGLAVTTHFLFVRQLDRAATASLEEKARGLHGYLQFTDGLPVLQYERDDAEAAAFVDDATDYYQVFDARDGRLLSQSPGLEALGLHYTPDEVAELRARAGTHDVQTDRGRLRLVSSLISPTPGEAYLVQVGELLTEEDATLAGFDGLLAWTILGGLVLAAIAGRFAAGRALAPLSRLAVAAHGVGIGSLDARLAVRGAHDELDQVAQSFNHALARLELSVAEMRQFSAALAHELRTPVAILRGEAELALRPSASDDDLRQVLMRQIDEFDRLTRLINQILMLARAEGGEITMADQSVNLVALGASVAEQIEPVAFAKGMTLTCDLADSVWVKGDAGWLQRLLLILLDNAIKFTPEGGRISVTCTPMNGLVRLAVTDTGMGISPEVLPHLFERFYRADPARSRQTDGAGLGLALAKWIVERHGGTIDVRSRPGHGSTFTVSLPAAAESRGHVACPPASRNGDSGAKRVAEADYRSTSSP